MHNSNSAICIEQGQNQYLGYYESKFMVIVTSNAID